MFYLVTFRSLTVSLSCCSSSSEYLGLPVDGPDPISSSAWKPDILTSALQNDVRSGRLEAGFEGSPEKVTKGVTLVLLRLNGQVGRQRRITSEALKGTFKEAEKLNHSKANAFSKKIQAEQLGFM